MQMSGVIVPFIKYKYQRRSEEKAEGHAYTDVSAETYTIRTHTYMYMCAWGRYTRPWA